MESSLLKAKQKQKITSLLTPGFSLWDCVNTVDPAIAAVSGFCLENQLHEDTMRVLRS